MQALVLGIIQGFTEFLPISSSGHLVFVPRLFGWGDQGLSFDVMVHLGTLLAVVVYFRRKLWAVMKAMVGKETRNKKQETSDLRRFGWLILLTIIPAGVVGLLFNDWIEMSLRATWVIGVGLIFWGILLGIADYYSKKTVVHSQKSVDQLNWKSALFIGCAQAIALIPGTSRSGITMTAGLFSKLDKKSAAEFSFLMSVPIIAMAGGLKVIDLVQTGLGDISLLVLSAGFIASAFSGFIAIWGLMKIIQKWSFMPFVVYRVVVGIAILVWLV
ncbi:undecaprenyl-diphosphate phosphatase [Patescibacteria group bacterium]|nr:undecaprenyl-diphosphate phosphatase [Patescibacteria group bacterium]MBU1896127.1 undecaprenyl-diphosphate phosphatase [Patescibacteria group bacterium]